jgi:flagellar motor switch/type III secretory pathway protein FliN
MTIKTSQFYPLVEKALYSLDPTLLIKKWDFDLEKFTSNLQDHLGLNDLKIQANNGRLVLKKDLSVKENILIPFLMTPIEGTIYWSIPKKDLNTLFSKIAGMDKEDYTIPSIQEGLTEFIVLKILTLLSDTPEMKPFSLKRHSDHSLKENAYFIVPFQGTINDKSFSFDLLIDVQFKKHFNEYWKDMPSSKQDLWENSLSLPLHFLIGKTTLSQNEMKHLKIGDVLLFDHKLYDPKQKKMKALCSLGNINLFFVKIKNQQIKITELANLEENPMEEKHFEENEHFEEELKTEETEEIKEKPIISKEEKLTSLKEIPVCVVAEMARISLPLNQLLELQIGSYLPVSLNPDEPINLTVNDAIVGKAELVYIGETIGMRILSLKK